MAPVIMVNDATYGSMSVQKMDEVVRKYQAME
jgi:NADH-quinone oxidoreductase subunit E